MTWRMPSARNWPVGAGPRSSVSGRLKASHRPPVHPHRCALAHPLRAAPGLQGIRIAPSATNFLFIDLGRPSGRVNEALLAHGIITKPWKDPGFETFLRVSVGAAGDLERLVQALTAIFEADA